MGLLLGHFIAAGAAGPLVGLSDITPVSNATSASIVWAGIRFDSDGTEDRQIFNGAWTDAARGNWLISGDAADVWIERIISLGSLFTDPGTGRHNLATSREFSTRRTTIGTDTCDLVFKAWDAASGGNLLDETVTIRIQSIRLP